MSYSAISLLGLILNFITNREILKNIKLQPGTEKEEHQAVNRYSWFLLTAIGFFISDIAWGIFYDHHENDAVFPFLYSSCVFYFIFMFMTMLTWIRFLVAYLNKKRRRGTSLLYAGWIIFLFALVYLAINRYYPFIFSFNARHEYVPESGRQIAFLLQIVLYLATTTYMLIIAHKSRGEDKIRYSAVGTTCLVIEIFLILQILDHNRPFYAMGLIIGICIIHSFVELREKREKEIYDNLARGLAEDYAAMYYIEIETGEYQEFVISQEYKAMRVPIEGRDFYAETRENIKTFVYPDDQPLAQSLHQKANMISNMEGKKSFSYKYRVMADNQPRVFLFTLKTSPDGKYFVLYEKDIQDDIAAEAKRLENQKKQVTFTQIAESLATNYDVIYYVDAASSSYVSFESRNIYGKLAARKTGDDYYADSLLDVKAIVHPGDQEMVLEFLNKDNMISTFKDRKSESIEYRILADNIVHYVRLTVRKSSDGTHYIIGIENIDAEIQREKQHIKALNSARELARRDELTGVKNKTAYTELEKSLQESIDKGIDDLPFAIVVCDANNLKKINDSEGHMAGDEYIKNTAKLLCNIFVHSPVFRVGGDEFVVFLRGDDYSNRAGLMKSLRDKVNENLKTGSKPIVASGMSEFIPEADTRVLQVFDRADKEMYENKVNLKNEEVLES